MIIVIAVILVLAAAVPIAFALVLQNRGDKKWAYRLLSSESPSLTGLNRCIGRLSAFKDAESHELVRQLMAKKQAIKL